MIDRLHIALIGFVAAFGLHQCGLSEGTKRGKAQTEAAQARENLAAQIAADEVQARVDGLSLRIAEIETQRQTVTKEIRHESERIIERPVYRSVCIEPDGLRLLDHAAAIANGELTQSVAPPDDAAAVAAQGLPNPDAATRHLSAPYMTGADCLRSLIDLYDVAGQTRAQLIALQSQVSLTQQVSLIQGAAQ